MPYIKADQDKFINERHIRWIQRINDTMEVCAKATGCTLGADTIRVSKDIHPDSFERLNRLILQKSDRIPHIIDTNVQLP